LSSKWISCFVASAYNEELSSSKRGSEVKRPREKEGERPREKEGERPREKEGERPREKE
jgi:hypothetical protein